MPEHNRAMTIIHISTALSWRGGEQQIAYLLVELSKLNIEQIVVCPENSPLFLFCEKNSIQVKSFHKRSGFDPWLALKITQLCRRAKNPIIHAHDSHAHSAGFLSAFLWMNKTPIVVHRRVGFNPNKSLLSAIKYNHHSITKIICISEYVREIMNSGLADPKKTVTVYDGIDLHKFAGQSDTNILRKRFNLTIKHTLIGNISAITVEKDYVTFVDTASILLSIHPDLRFFIIGDGAQRQYISDYIKEKGLESKILMTGFLDNIQEILPELELILFTSVNEGLGTTLLDAFACRIPVVATNAGGIPEIVKNHITGLTTEIRNPAEMAAAVEEILINTELKNTIVDNAFRKVQDFSTENMALKIIEIYNEIFRN